MKYSWIAKPLFWFQKRRYGNVLPPTWEWAKSPGAMYTFLSFYKFLTRKNSPLPRGLLPIVGLHVAKIVGCGFCATFNASQIQKMEPSDQELIALEYAEMIARGKHDPELIKKVKAAFSEKAVVELTAYIGCQLLSSRFNLALDVSNADY